MQHLLHLDTTSGGNFWAQNWKLHTKTWPQSDLCWDSQIEVGSRILVAEKKNRFTSVSPAPVSPKFPAGLGNLLPVVHWTEEETILPSSTGLQMLLCYTWAAKLVLNGWFHKQGFRGFKGEKGEPGLPGLDGLDAPCPVVWCSFFPFMFFPACYIYMHVCLEV